MENNLHPRILYPLKLYVMYEGRIKKILVLPKVKKNYIVHKLSQEAT